MDTNILVREKNLNEKFIKKDQHQKRSRFDKNTQPSINAVAGEKAHAWHVNNTIG